MSDEEFSISFARAHVFGVLAGVRLPKGNAPVSEGVLARLHADERAYARTLKGFRQIEWTGARLAWHAACALLGIDALPLLSSPARAPIAPAGLTVSVTHKRDLALVLVGDARHGDLGLDLEDDLRAASVVAEKILVPEELDAVRALHEADRASAILMRFAFKEAVYKAVYPHVRRRMGYDEAVIDAASNVRLQLSTESAAPELTIETATEWLDGTRIIAAVRCRRTTPPSA